MRVSGTMAVPGDKSISHRALMLSGIAEGLSEVSGFLASEDCLASLAAMRALGVRIEQRSATHVLIHGVGMHGLQRRRPGPRHGQRGHRDAPVHRDCCAAQKFDSQLIGDASLMKRPMERVAQAAARNGRRCAHAQWHAAGGIIGGRQLRGIDYRMPIASAQVKSAILLAALYAAEPTTMTAPAMSRDHSERMLQQLRRAAGHAMACAHLASAAALGESKDRVPGDFSSAAFFIVAGLLAAPTRGC